MTMLQLVLSTLIRNGKVIVETPDLDMDELRKVVRSRAFQPPVKKEETRLSKLYSTSW